MACLEQTEWGYDYAVGAERQGRTRDLFNQFSSWMTHNMASFGRGGVVEHGAHTEITHMLKRPQWSLYKERPCYNTYRYSEPDSAFQVPVFLQ